MDWENNNSDDEGDKRGGGCSWDSNWPRNPGRQRIGGGGGYWKTGDGDGDEEGEKWGEGKNEEE